MKRTPPSQLIESNQLLTVDELALILRVPKCWIYRQTSLGQSAIPHYKLHGYLRFDKDKVLKHFNGHQ